MSPAELSVNLAPFLPEFVLIGGILILLICNLIVRRQPGMMMAAGGILVLAATAAVSLSGSDTIGEYFFGAVLQDGITIFFRVFFCAAGIVSIAIMTYTFRDDGEPYLLVLSGIAGMFLLAGANDVVTLFVALELVSIPSYVFAGYRRNDARSAEAALKYVLYGAFSSGLLLYGLSLIYGLAGTTTIPDIAARLTKTGGHDAALLMALILILSGIGYKIAMVPLHFWCPDVYEGSPTAITAFFSVVPKAAGFAALLRLTPVFMPLITAFGFSSVTLLTVASALTMTFGNLGAIWQTSMKRLLAYSSIAHAGYILMGFAVIASGPAYDIYQQSILGILFYLITYLFMNFGAFFVVDQVERKLGGESVAHFKGLGQTQTKLALLMAVFLFSLVGLPPLAGFVGKFLLFAALIKGKLFALALIGVANTVISLFYYVRIIRDMFLRDPDPETEGAVPAAQSALGWLAAILAFVTVVPTLVLGLWWGPLAEWIRLRL
jgi:NADH-quinone oxidoreductase subunit N